MPGFRNRRISLLVVALLLSGLFITSPWATPDKDAPFSNVIRGPNWGVDITGGSRIMLHLKATQATIGLPQSASGDYSAYADDVLERFRTNLQSPVTSIIKENIEQTGQLTLEIGKYVSENLINSLLEGQETLDKYDMGAVSSPTQNKVKNSLKMRVDPYGTLGAQFKPLGGKNQYLQFEVSLDLDKAKDLLGKEGLPEVFVDNQRVVWSEHIRNVQKKYGRQGWGVTFTLTEEGKERFADYTGRKEGIPEKEGRPGVIYLDRPTDSVLLFDTVLENRVEQQAQNLGMEEAEYLESVHRFRFKTPENIQTPLDEGHWFYIQVPAVRINNGISSYSENYILDKKKSEEFDKALLFGKKKEFSNEIINKNNLIIDNQPVLPVENTTRLVSEGESYIEWFNRVCGLESWPTLQPSITASPENIQEGLIITTGSESEAEDLRIILSQRLSVEVTHISEKEIDPRLGQEFVKEAAIAALAAFAVVGILVYSFYRKFKIAVPLLLTMASEVIITLGAASAVPDGLMSIGLPGLGGLIAVIGTGVDHQIIIADEVLGEKFSESRRLPIDRRTGRAFTIIFAAAATTIAAMIALATFGFGAMRGFAIITLFGVLISVLITRPAYAQIIGTLLKREQEKK